jgi:hypothetical protein
MIGFAVLVMGRQIFWVFVAGLGFALGVVFGEQFYSGQPEWIILVIGTLAGVLGALLAYNLQRLAGVIAGFAAGWYLTNLLSTYTGIQLSQYDYLLPIIIGVICSISMVVFFDWSAILLSSFAGSAIIIEGMNFTYRTELIILIAFAFLGVVIQAIWFIQEDEQR